MFENFGPTLTLLHTERPKLHSVLAVLSAIGLKKDAPLSSLNDIFAPPALLTLSEVKLKGLSY